MGQLFPWYLRSSSFDARLKNQQLTSDFFLKNVSFSGSSSLVNRISSKSHLQGASFIYFKHQCPCDKFDETTSLIGQLFPRFLHHSMHVLIINNWRLCCSSSLSVCCIDVWLLYPPRVSKLINTDNQHSRLFASGAQRECRLELYESKFSAEAETPSPGFKQAA